MRDDCDKKADNHWRQWEGETVGVIASGPSLERWQCDALTERHRTIAVNSSFQWAPRAAAVYGCDGSWWQRYHQEVPEQSQKWTQDKAAAARLGLLHVSGTNGKGLNTRTAHVNTGQNSGYQAIGLAYQFGAKRIILIGFDMKKTGGKAHFFGDHPQGLRNAEGVERWVVHFGRLAKDLEHEGIEVLNCTIDTALECFTRADLRDVL